MEHGPAGYGTIARMLHWLVAALILAMIPVGLLMVQKGLDRDLGDALYLFHKNVGSLLIVVIALRLVWRLTHRPPSLPATVPDWQRRLAGLSHLALYVLMVVMPLSGYVRVRAGGFPIEGLDALGMPTFIPRSKSLADAASTLHEMAAWALIAVIALHIGAAVHHAVVRRDEIWSRMWPPRVR
ncbi:cytochrome b [Paracoccus sp. Ld10]|uniref:cytochrome b n=1 Tax=Paracoccus sp. Ld10 TaxID=649158 RepID=UPI00386D996A